MKVNLMLLAYFYWSLLWHAMFLHFPFLVVEVRGAIKRRKNISDDDNSLYKTSAITGNFV